MAIGRILLTACAGTIAALGMAEDSFLGLSFGARPVALGGAYAAVADDAHAAWWNPAGLSGVTNMQLAGSQNHLTFTDNAYSITLAVPAGAAGTFSAGVGHLSITNAALTRPVQDPAGNPVLDPSTGQPLVELTGFGQENDATFLLGWGSALGPVSIGVSGRFLLGKAGPVRGTGIGGAAGMICRLPLRLSLGLVANDLGRTTVHWKDGARTLLQVAGKAGLGWRAGDSWLFTMEMRSPLLRAKLTAGGGIEWRVAEQLAFRLGTDDGRATGGAGFRMPLGEGTVATADYAFVAGGAFEDRNRLTLAMEF